MKKNLSIIITLYKTPSKMLNNLVQYKDFKLFIFDHDIQNNKSKISSILKKKFYYNFSKYNVGLSRATNFLISKVKTKYFLFTQADIKISKKSISALLSAFRQDKNIIFAAPVLKKSFTKGIKAKLQYQNDLDASVMMCDTKKVKKLGFFDENFFLYWEDKDLMQRVKKSSFKMVKVLHSNAVHLGGKSTQDDNNTKLVRKINFKYGEFVFDLKYKRLRLLKIIRNFFKNSIFLIFNIFFFNKSGLINNYSNIAGTLKFIYNFLFKKIKFK